MDYKSRRKLSSFEIMSRNNGLGLRSNCGIINTKKGGKNNQKEACMKKTINTFSICGRFKLYDYTCCRKFFNRRGKAVQ